MDPKTCGRFLALLATMAALYGTGKVGDLTRADAARAARIAANA